MDPDTSLPPARRLRLDRLRRELLGSLPGRLLVVGASVRLVAWLVRNALGLDVPVIAAIGTLGSIAAVVGIVHFTYKLLVRVKRRLLWRVRRKLILSYIFVGVVPVLLLVAFFLLAGLLLFFNVGSYLVASSVRRAIDDARYVAQETATSIQAGAGHENVTPALERGRSALAQRYPGASVALVPTGAEPCAGIAALAPRLRTAPGRQAIPADRPAPANVGPWTFLEPPAVLPAWVSCAGFGGLIAVSPAVDASDKSGSGQQDVMVVIRAAGVPEGREPRFAVVVDLPFDAALEARIRDETSVKIGHIWLQAGPGGRARTTRTTATTPATGTRTDDATRGRGIQSLASFEAVDWATGPTADRVMVSFDTRVADIYERVSAAGGRIAGTWSLGSLALLVLGTLAVLFFIIEIVALVMGLVLARSITGSVHQLFTGTERVRKGDFSHKIRIETRDQMGELAESFNSMTASIEDLLRQAEEKKRLEEELRIARRIQMSLLPRGQLAMPGLSITALCVPAREVGGDYYDLLPLEGGRLGVLIADVAGKGTSAAFYMAELKGLILSLSRIYQSPRQLLIEANRLIANHLGSRSFITMAYAVVDLQARTMTWCRAGHTPLIQRTNNGNGKAEVRILAPDGLVVGLQMDDAGALFERLLKEEQVPLRQGDLFMFFTDGISEAMNTDSDCFGEARLSEIVGEHGDLPSEELRERILREIGAFVGTAPQHDDMTMILLKVEDVVSVPPLGDEAAATRAMVH